MSIILLLAMEYKKAQNIMRVFIHLQLIMVIISIFLNYYYCEVETTGGEYLQTQLLVSNLFTLFTSNPVGFLM